MMSLYDDILIRYINIHYHPRFDNCEPRFIKLGHQPFDAVAMWGFNAPEWMFSTFAAMMAGGMAGGLYPTDTPETAAFKVAHSGVTWHK